MCQYKSVLSERIHLPHGHLEEFILVRWTRKRLLSEVVAYGNQMIV